MKIEMKKRYALLSDIVYDTIKDAIITEKLPIDEKISETQLAKELDVSRTPVREALRKLSVEGFVKLESNTSFIINKFDKKACMEVLAVRRLLEGEAARLAALNLTEENKERLKEEISIIENIGANADQRGESENAISAECVRYDVHFHNVVYEIAGNEKLYSISTLMQDKQLRYYLAKGWLKGNYDEVFFEQHKQIATAILSGNSEKAEKLVHDHIDYIMNLAEEIE